jgi:hypothetical protein
MTVPTYCTTPLKGGAGGDSTLDRVDTTFAFIDPGVDQCRLTLYLLTGDHIMRPQPMTREI